MDESEDHDGTEAGDISAGSNVPKGRGSVTTSTPNDLDNKNEDEVAEQVDTMEEEAAEEEGEVKDCPNQNDEAEVSEHTENKDDGSSTSQPVTLVDEANGKLPSLDEIKGAQRALPEGIDDSGKEAEKIEEEAEKSVEEAEKSEKEAEKREKGTEKIEERTENSEKQSQEDDDDTNKMEKGRMEQEETRLNEKSKDEAEKGGREEKNVEKEPEEVEMKDLTEHADIPEDGEIVEESQASTSQNVGISQADVVLEDAVEDEEVVEVKTLEEAKERIGVLEKRIERETKQRLDLVKQVKSLSQELRKLKGGSGLETHAVAVQTDPECIQIYDEQPPTQQAEVYQVMESSSSVQQGSSRAGQAQWPARTQTSSSSSSTQVQSIAESVRATAEAALAQSGVVLDEASGMYYDYNSGYYYDPNNHLYYDPARGIYYYYDEQTQSYQYHSKIDLAEVVVRGMAGGSRGQSDGRRHERDRRRGDRTRRRRNHSDQNRDEFGSNERPSTSRRIGSAECEVIDITSPVEDCPENGLDTTTSGTTTTTSQRTTKAQDVFRDQNDSVDVVEIVDDDDSSRRRHRRRSRSLHSARKRRRTGGEEERKENGAEDLPDVIVIDSEESDMEEGELSDSSLESGGSSKGESCDDAEGDDVSEESMIIDDDDDVQSVEATKVDYPPCIRMIVVRSESMKLGSLSIVTCTGGTIGREGSNHILLVPELGVSKTHAQMAYDTERKGYTITDLGSQNGTVLNGVPLTRKSRVKSDPQPLSHKDYLTFGTTTLRIHIHRGDETCDECEPGQVQAAFRHQQSMEVTPVISQADKEQQRRKELRKIKKKYLLAGADYSQREPSVVHAGYKDRAEERRVTVGSDNPYQIDDMPASVDRAISGDNMGHKMLKKMGWKEGQSLGKNESGIKEPIQAFLYSKKSGLGAGNQKSMDSLDLIGKRKSENWERARDRYHHLDQATTSAGTSSRQSSRPQEMKWVKGTTQVNDGEKSIPGPQQEDDGDVEVVAMEKDIGNDHCDVVMDDGEGKDEGGGGSDSRMVLKSSDGSTKKSGVVEETTTDETSKAAPSISGDDSKAVPSSSNNDASHNVTESEVGASLESESATKSESSDQVGAVTKQTRLESSISKDSAADKTISSSSLSHKGERNSVEVPVEREAAKKPIRFVIPPRMNSKGDSGKTPLTASRSVSENNGESPSTRRTRQSSRRGKEKRDNIDMFDNG